MTKIVFEKEKCIGCGSCAALCPKYWETGDDGKVHLKGSKTDIQTSNEELEIETIDCAKEAVDTCPVQCIHIVN